MQSTNSTDSLGNFEPNSSTITEPLPNASASSVPPRSLPPALAGDSAANTSVAQGSSLAARAEDDGWVGQVYIYVGGSLPAGTNLLEFRFVGARQRMS